MILTDLDILLKDFDKLDLQADEEVGELKADLLNQLSGCNQRNEAPSADGIRTLMRSTSFRGKFQTFLRVAADMREGIAPTEPNLEMVEDLLNASSHAAQLEILKSETSLQSKKEQLLARLRNHGIFVLSKGAIEDYYDPAWPLNGADKPTKAEIMRSNVDSREKALALAGEVLDGEGNLANEFAEMFGRVFRDV